MNNLPYYSIVKKSEEFGSWIVQELERLGWSRSELARRANFSPSRVDQVVNGIGDPGDKFCRGVARAFGLPVEEVLRRAGRLPVISDEEAKLFESIKARIGLLSPAQRAELDRYVDYLVSSAQAEREPRGAIRAAADAGAARPKYSSGDDVDRGTEPTAKSTLRST